MQLNMKTLNIIVLLLVTLSSCGQTVSTDKPQTANKPTSQEALAVYQTMTSEICNCTSTTMKNSKPSTTLDSCYKVILDQYTDTLKAFGYDPASSVGQNKLLNEIRLYQCRDLYSLMQKEWSDEEAKKLLFKGEFVSQKKLATGEYEITLKDSKRKEQKVFRAKSPFDESSVKKYLPGYELTIEYEVVKNSKTNKDEFYIKESGTVSSVGAVPVTNQK
jgi:hypothetical protein